MLMRIDVVGTRNNTAAARPCAPFATQALARTRKPWPGASTCSPTQSYSTTLEHTQVPD